MDRGISVDDPVRGSEQPFTRGRRVGQPHADGQGAGRGASAPTGLRRFAACSLMAGMARVVVDTNIFVAAAFNRRSASAELISDLRDGTRRLVWNEETRHETKSVLRRIPKLSWDDVSGLFAADGRFDGPTDPAAFAMVSDPGDRKFAALSAAANCPLVSNDQDLLEHRDRIGIAIFTPGDFVRRQG